MEYKYSKIAAVFFIIATGCFYLYKPSLKEELREHHYATFFCDYSRLINNASSYSKEVGKIGLKSNRYMMIDEGYSLEDIAEMEYEAKQQAIKESEKSKILIQLDKLEEEYKQDNS